MSAQAAIIAIGNELLDGRVLDTNSFFLAGKLQALGIEISKIVLCPDDLDHIVSELAALPPGISFAICCGGLGPTSDDLTREALAKFAGVGLHFDEQICAALEARYAKRGVQMDPSNKRQAYFPDTSEIVPNSFGTAAGFCLRLNKVEFYALPGVPSELKGIYAEVLEGRLKAAGYTKPKTQIAFRIFGRPEATLNSMMRELKLDPRIFVSYRADFPEVHLQLSSDTGSTLVGEAARVLEAVAPEYVVSTDPKQGMPEVLQQLMREKKQTLALAESCTGGLAGTLVTDAPGASEIFLGGVQCYADSVKRDLLSVRAETLEQHGAVSAEVAMELASGVRQALKADIGVSITGIAGPDGGSEQKPVGTFYIGLCTGSLHCAFKHFLPSSRDYVRRYAAFMALDTVRRTLIGAEPLGEITIQIANENASP